MFGFFKNPAIIANFDLIITCDSVIAHLAGSMAKKTWLLLRYMPCWSYGMTGDSTFWYPSVKLFRQNESNNLNELMFRLSRELKMEIEEIT
tara:strand:- start:1188 stop:1460 length:273 start_codon:yes stop_codon:yes gene_type:complete